jgi:hypothetical protein
LFLNKWLSNKISDKETYKVNGGIIFSPCVYGHKLLVDDIVAPPTLPTLWGCDKEFFKTKHAVVLNVEVNIGLENNSNIQFNAVADAASI